MVDGEPSNPGSEPFVEPQLSFVLAWLIKSMITAYLVPPIHGYEISEPLMGQLVSDNVGNTALVSLIGFLLVEKYGGSARTCERGSLCDDMEGAYR